MRGRTRLSWILPALVPVVLVAASCGGDGDSATDDTPGDTTGAEQDDDGPDERVLSDDEAAVVDVLAAEFLDSEEGDVMFSSGEAECAGTFLLDELGLDRLEELGITAEGSPDFDVEPFPGERADAEAFVDSLGECVGFDELSLRTAEVLSGGSSIDPDCVTGAVGPDSVREMGIAALLESPEVGGLVDDFILAIESCGATGFNDRLAEELQGQFGGTIEDAACAADGFRDELGISGFSDLAIGEIPLGQAEALVDTLDECYGLLELFGQSLAADGSSDEQVACITEQVGADGFRSLLVAQFSGETPSDELGELLLTAEVECG